MKLVLYDKCWDAIIQLPKTIQKKVPEFIQKFRADSKAAAIHLEPISTFRDPNLRTARIDQKYRAIISVPNSGDVYHLLWIDNHDEAMNWARNKLFSWNEHTQSYQVFTAPESIEPPQAASNPGPKEPEGILDSYTDVALLQIGVPAVLLPSVRKMQDLGHLEALEPYLPVEAFENLFNLLDGEDIQRIIEEVGEGKVASADFEAQLKSPNNQRSFFELSDDEALNEILSGTLQKWKIYLHPSQKTLVNSNFKGSVKVSGGAGTGKTVAALHRAKYLLEHEMGGGGKAILFTTYTKSLTRNLEKDLADLKINSSRKIVLNNIDAFAMEEAQRLGLIDKSAKLLDFPGVKSSAELWAEVLDQELSEFEAAFLEAEWKNVILFNNVKTLVNYFNTSRTGQRSKISRKDKMHIWNLGQAYEEHKQSQLLLDKAEVFNALYDHYRNEPNKPFGHIIADEIQDFSDVELRLLRVLVEEKPNDLFLVGDPLQRIYGRTLNFSKAGIHIRGRRSRRLKINYRTTEEIRRSAVATIRNENFEDFDGAIEQKNGYVSLRHGQKPAYQVFREKGLELDYVVERIRQYTDPNVAGAFQFSEICVAARTRNGIKEILSRLHREQIPYFDMTTASGKGSAGQGVRLSTFHNVKGLEFKVVILMDVNERTLPFHPVAYSEWDEASKLAHDKAELALMYVAMTRAVHVLEVTGVGVKSGVLGV